jgi:hypothetical protein
MPDYAFREVTMAKLKLPKRFAGSKVPKGWRLSVNQLASRLDSPLWREIVAEALVAAASALIGGRYVRETASQAGREVAADTETALGYSNDGASARKAEIAAEMKAKKGKQHKRKGVDERKERRVHRTQ